MSDKPVAAGKSSFDLIDTEKAFAIMDIKPDSVFIDLACGVGKYSIEVAKNIGENGKVYAVDLWQEGVEILDQEIGAIGLKNIQTMNADIRKKLPLEEYSIDACLLATILHDLSKDDQKTAIAEIARLLKINGMLNIIEFKKLDTGPGPPLNIRMDGGEIEALISPYGFVRIAGSDVGEFNYMLKYRKSA